MTVRATRTAVRREITGDAQSDRMQRQAQQLASAVNLNPFISGNLVKGVVVVTGAAGTTINHGLGRKWSGYIVVRQQGNASAIVESLTQPDPTRQIALLASVQTTVDLWFF